MNEGPRVERIQELDIVVGPGELTPKLVGIGAFDGSARRQARCYEIRLRQVLQVVHRHETPEYVVPRRPDADPGLIDGTRFHDLSGEPSRAIPAIDQPGLGP